MQLKKKHGCIFRVSCCRRESSTSASEATASTTVWTIHRTHFFSLLVCLDLALHCLVQHVDFCISGATKSMSGSKRRYQRAQPELEGYCGRLPVWCARTWIYCNRKEARASCGNSARRDCAGRTGVRRSPRRVGCSAPGSRCRCSRRPRWGGSGPGGPSVPGSRASAA